MCSFSRDSTLRRCWVKHVAVLRLAQHVRDDAELSSGSLIGTQCVDVRSQRLHGFFNPTQRSLGSSTSSVLHPQLCTLTVASIGCAKQTSTSTRDRALLGEQLIRRHKLVRIFAKHRDCSSLVDAASHGTLVLFREFLSNKVPRAHVHLVRFFWQHTWSPAKVPRSLHSAWIHGRSRVQYLASLLLPMSRASIATLDGFFHPAIVSVQLSCKHPHVGHAAHCFSPVRILTFQPSESLVVNSSTQISNVIPVNIHAIICELECAHLLICKLARFHKLSKSRDCGEVCKINSLLRSLLKECGIQLASP